MLPSGRARFRADLLSGLPLQRSTLIHQAIAALAARRGAVRLRRGAAADPGIASIKSIKTIKAIEAIETNKALRTRRSMDNQLPADVAQMLRETATHFNLDVLGGKIRRSSSRFCLGVEHGDYNGTELFGVGTDRFIWLAYKPNGLGRFRLASGNFPEDGLVDLDPSSIPPAKSHSSSWARFPFGVADVLQRSGFACRRGFDAVLYGNIPGGGMSRSASLCLNLILTMFEVNHIEGVQGMQIVDLAQAVENDYIGSPCGNLDQIMIYFAKEGRGTHYRPADRSVSHLTLGPTDADIRIVSLDTGTDRPGLENSTYMIRRKECEQLVELASEPFGISCLADVRDEAMYQAVLFRFGALHPHLGRRLKYIVEAQRRFAMMLNAWQAGDWSIIGQVFRQDGWGLRDDYQISGPELETMCDIVRTIPGVLGERMLGGGDKGAAGALVHANSVEAMQQAVSIGYPASRPAFADRFAVHVCQIVDGITDLPGLTTEIY